MTKSRTETLIIYSTVWCGDCKSTFRFLDQHQIPYEVIDIEQDETAMALVEKINKGYHSVPTIVFPDGSTLTEPSYSQLAEKLEIPFGNG